MRKRVTLAYIANNQQRKASFNKRKKGFLKKLDELCTLCDVEASCILYSEYETGPVVWPNPEAAHSVLERFKTISPLERTKKMLDQESYNMMRIKKIHEKWYKIHKENVRRLLKLYMFQVIAGKMSLDCFDIRYAADMKWVITQVLKDMDAQIDMFKRQNSEETSHIAGGRASDDVGFPLFGHEINMLNNQFVGFDAVYNDGGDCEDDGINDDDDVKSSSSIDDNYNEDDNNEDEKDDGFWN